MAQYSKAIVAIIMMVALFLKAGFGVDWDLDQATLQTWIDTGIAIFTPVFVYLFPNKAIGGATLRSPAVVTGLAFAISLGVLLALSACASFSVPKDATFDRRLDAAETDLGTADLFIALYAGFPECGASVPQPCRVAVVVTVLQRGSDGVREAIADARKLIAAKSPEAKILVALQLVQQKLLELMQARDRAATTAPGALMASAPAS